MATFSNAALVAGAPKYRFPLSRRTKNKEGGHFLIGFIAFCQSRSSVLQTNGASFRHPASVLAPESALGSLPSVALSSAQADRILRRPSKRLLRYWRLPE